MPSDGMGIPWGELEKLVAYYPDDGKYVKSKESEKRHRAEYQPTMKSIMQNVAKLSRGGRRCSDAEEKDVCTGLKVVGRCLDGSLYRATTGWTDQQRWSVVIQLIFPLCARPIYQGPIRIQARKVLVQALQEALSSFPKAANALLNDLSTHIRSLLYYNAPGMEDSEKIDIALFPIFFYTVLPHRFVQWVEGTRDRTLVKYTAEGVSDLCHILSLLLSLVFELCDLPCLSPVVKSNALRQCGQAFPQILLWKEKGLIGVDDFSLVVASVLPLACRRDLMRDISLRFVKCVEYLFNYFGTMGAFESQRYDMLQSSLADALVSMSEVFEIDVLGGSLPSILEVWVKLQWPVRPLVAFIKSRGRGGNFISAWLGKRLHEVQPKGNPRELSKKLTEQQKDDEVKYTMELLEIYPSIGEVFENLSDSVDPKFLTILKKFTREAVESLKVDDVRGLKSPGVTAQAKSDVAEAYRIVLLALFARTNCRGVDELRKILPGVCKSMLENVMVFAWKFEACKQSGTKKHDVKDISEAPCACLQVVIDTFIYLNYETKGEVKIEFLILERLLSTLWMSMEDRALPNSKNTNGLRKSECKLFLSALHLAIVGDYEYVQTFKLLRRFMASTTAQSSSLGASVWVALGRLLVRTAAKPVTEGKSSIAFIPPSDWCRQLSQMIGQANNAATACAVPAMCYTLPLIVLHCGMPNCSEICSANPTISMPIPSSPAVGCGARAVARQALGPPVVGSCENWALPRRCATPMIEGEKKVRKVFHEQYFSLPTCPWCGVRAGGLDVEKEKFCDAVANRAQCGMLTSRPSDSGDDPMTGNSSSSSSHTSYKQERLRRSDFITECHACGEVFLNCDGSHLFTDVGEEDQMSLPTAYFQVRQNQAPWIGISGSPEPRHLRLFSETLHSFATFSSKHVLSGQQNSLPVESRMQFQLAVTGLCALASTSCVRAHGRAILELIKNFVGPLNGYGFSPLTTIVESDVFLGGLYGVKNIDKPITQRRSSGAKPPPGSKPQQQKMIGEWIVGDPIADESRMEVFRHRHELLLGFVPNQSAPSHQWLSDFEKPLSPCLIRAFVLTADERTLTNFIMRLLKQCSQAAQTVSAIALYQLWWVFATLRAEAHHVLNRLEPALIYGAGLFSTGLKRFMAIHDVAELLLNRRFEYIVRKHVAHYLPQMMSLLHVGNIYQVCDVAEAKLISPGIHHALAAAARSTVDDAKKQLKFLCEDVQRDPGHAFLQNLLEAQLSKVVVLLCWQSAREPEEVRLAVAHRAIVQHFTAMVCSNFIEDNDGQPKSKRRRTSVSNKRRNSLGVGVAAHPGPEYDTKLGVEVAVDGGRVRDHIDVLIRQTIIQMIRLFHGILSFCHGEDLVDKNENRQKIVRKLRGKDCPCDFERFFAALTIFFDIFARKHVEHMGSKLLELMRTATSGAIRVGSHNSAMKAWHNLLTHAHNSSNAISVLPYAAVFKELAKFRFCPMGNNLLQSYGTIMRQEIKKREFVPGIFISGRSSMKNAMDPNQHKHVIGKYLKAWYGGDEENADAKAQRGNYLIARVIRAPTEQNQTWDLEFRTADKWNHVVQHFSHQLLQPLDTGDDDRYPLAIVPSSQVLIGDDDYSKALRQLWVDSGEPADVRARRTLEMMSEPGHILQKIALVTVLRDLLLDSMTMQHMTPIKQKLKRQILSDVVKSEMLWPVLHTAQNVGQDEETHWALIGETLGLIGVVDPGNVNEENFSSPMPFTAQEVSTMELNNHTFNVSFELEDTTCEIALELFNLVTPHVDVDEFGMAMQELLKVVAGTSAISLSAGERHSEKHLKETRIYKEYFSAEIKSAILPFIRSDFKRVSAVDLSDDNVTLASAVLWCTETLLEINKKPPPRSDTRRRYNHFFLGRLFKAVSSAVEYDVSFAAKVLPKVVSVICAYLPQERFEHMLEVDQPMYTRLQKLLKLEPVCVASVFQCCDIIRNYRHQVEYLYAPAKYQIVTLSRRNKDQSEFLQWNEKVLKWSVKRMRVIEGWFIKSRDIVTASLRVGAWQRALMSLEACMRQKTEFQVLQTKIPAGTMGIRVGENYSFSKPAPKPEDVEHLQNIYRALDENAGERGVLAVSHNYYYETIKESEDKRVLDYGKMSTHLVGLHEQRADWQNAIRAQDAIRQVTQDEKMISAAVRCAQAAGNWASSNDVIGDKWKTMEQLKPRAVRAAWELSDWSKLDDLLASDPERGQQNHSVTDICDLTTGRLLQQFQKSDGTFSESLNQERIRLARNVADAARESYHRAYPHLVLLHSTEDLLLLHNSDTTVNHVTKQECDGVIEAIMDRAKPLMTNWNERQRHVHCIERALQVMKRDTDLLRLSLWEQKKYRKQFGEGSNFKPGQPWWILAPPQPIEVEQKVDPVLQDLRRKLSIEHCKQLYVSGDVHLAMEYLEPQTSKVPELDSAGRLTEMKAKLLRLRWQMESHAQDPHVVTHKFIEIQSYFLEHGLVQTSKYSSVTFHFAQFLDKQLESVLAEAKREEEKAKEQPSPAKIGRTAALASHVLMTYILSLGDGARSVKRTYLVMNRLVHWISEISANSRLQVLRSAMAEVKKNLYGTLIQDGRVPSWTWFAVMPQIISRACSDQYDKLATDFFMKLLTKIWINHPEQAGWYLLPLQFHKNNDAAAAQAGRHQEPECRNKPVGDAIYNEVKQHWSKDPDGKAKLNALLKFQKFIEQMATFCDRGDAGFPDNGSVASISQLRIPKLVEMTKTLARLKQKELFIMPNLTALSLTNDLSCPLEKNPVKLTGLYDEVLILRSKQRPKRLTFIGSDGRKYHFLCKQEKKGDLRKDSRMMELCHMFNHLFSQMPEQNRRPLRVRTFMVVAISSGYGMIQWLDGLNTFRGIVNDEMAVTGQHQLGTLVGVFKTEMDNARGREPIVWNKLMQELPPVFQKWFSGSSRDPAHWYKRRIEYSCSLAVWSILGFIMGVGDRHCENILIDQELGEVVHVDFDCLFGKGTMLERPEIVPFRLTCNMVAALGVTGVEGTYRTVCETTIRMIRREKPLLFSTLSTFVADPLMEIHHQLTHEARTERRNGQMSAQFLTAKRSESSHLALHELTMKMDGYVNFSDNMVQWKDPTILAVKPASNDANLKRYTKMADDLFQIQHPKGNFKFRAIQLSVEEQVEELIKASTCDINLSLMYCGWMPWI